MLDTRQKTAQMHPTQNKVMGTSAAAGKGRIKHLYKIYTSIPFQGIQYKIYLLLYHNPGPGTPSLNYVGGCWS